MGLSPVEVVDINKSGGFSKVQNGVDNGENYAKASHHDVGDSQKGVFAPGPCRCGQNHRLGASV